MDPEFHGVTVGEQTWRYWESGQGRPVVLFHGFPDTPLSYVRIGRALTEAGYRAIVPYLRGYHPDTLVPGRPYDGVTLGEDAIGLLDALELESAVLVGHDWGAYAVYAAAALAPERAEAIVPIGIPHPKTLAPKNALQTIVLLLMARHFVYLQLPWAEAGTRRRSFAYIDQLYKRWAPDWKGEERDQAIARVKAHFAEPAVLQAAIQYYRDIRKTEGRRLSGTLRTRGLMVAGANDFGGHRGPYKKSQGLFDPRADVLFIPNAGHWPHLEDQGLFTRELLGFLANTP